MLRKISIVIAATLLFSLLLSMTACQNKESSSEDLKEVTHNVDRIHFTYQGLKDKAELIVKARVTDSLSKSNSVIETDPEDGDSLVEAYSKRKIEIIEVLGGKDGAKYKAGDTLTIVDMAAISEDSYIHPDDYNKLIKNTEYIMFLSNETASGLYGPLSMDNGQINLSSINDTNFFEVAVKGIVEYESNLPANDVKKIISSKVIDGANRSFSKNKKSVAIEELDAVVDYEFLSSNQTLIQIRQ